MYEIASVLFHNILKNVNFFDFFKNQFYINRISNLPNNSNGLKTKNIDLSPMLASGLPFSGTSNLKNKEIFLVFE